VDRRGGSGARRAEDLPHVTSNHGALAPKETLLLYISASTQVVSAVLVVERPEEGHPYPTQ
jgi:hypothetical protein